MAAKKKTTSSLTALDEKSSSKATPKYPPYVNAYGAIPKLFDEISKASVPPKFTQDFMESVLGMKSSSHRALLPLLKKLGFLDIGNVPTEAYKSYRDSSQAKRIMAERMRSAYADLFKANEYAHTLTKDQLTAKLKTLTGAADSDQYLPSVVGTFLELKKLSDFEAVSDGATKEREGETIDQDRDEGDVASRRRQVLPLGMSYTINLNLPATTDIDVFNAIFRSLKEHLISDR
jgi:hypothetical protein